MLCSWCVLVVLPEVRSRCGGRCPPCPSAAGGSPAPAPCSTPVTQHFINRSRPNRNSDQAELGTRVVIRFNVSPCHWREGKNTDKLQGVRIFFVTVLQRFTSFLVLLRICCDYRRLLCVRGVRDINPDLLRRARRARPRLVTRIPCTQTRIPDLQNFTARLAIAGKDFKEIKWTANDT